VRAVVAMTLALTLSSTGIAAAVQGNPFGPIDFVVEKLGHLGNYDRPSPVDLLGGRKAPLAGHRDRQQRNQAERDNRPSRSRSADPPGSGVDSQASLRPPIVARLDTEPTRREHAEKPRAHHHGPLVVQRPHDGPVDDPKPHGGETPPNRPEPPAIPSTPIWPKPGTGQRPAPPERPESAPMREAPQVAPVR
jgi:hypothetical protein